MLIVYCLIRSSDSDPGNSDRNTIANYGQLVVEMARSVPDGVVAFFTSYSYMQEIVREWHTMGLLKQVLQHKLVFIETNDVLETSLALENFKKRPT